MGQMDIHWRDTMRPARFFMLDARASIGIFIFLVHFSLWTIVVAILFMALFWMLEQRGLSYNAAMRRFRSWLCGDVRPAVSSKARSRFADFGDLTAID